MNKKHILALLSGTLLLASTVFGAPEKVKKNEDANLEKAEVPQELQKKHGNPFLEQDDARKNLFTEDKNFFTNDPDVFGASDSDSDPWDD
ncbi:MAG: hypothetical protein ACSW8C_01605 [bacterium]